MKKLLIIGIVIVLCLTSCIEPGSDEYTQNISSNEKSHKQFREKFKYEKYEEGVFVKSPWGFDKYGIDNTTSQQELEWKVFTTNFFEFKTTPIIHTETFDDIVSLDNILMDVTAYITTQIQAGQLHLLLKNFGANWFQDNIQMKFRSLIRDRISKYSIQDLTSNRHLLQDIEKYIEKEITTEVRQKGMPVNIVSININQCLPNKDKLLQ